MKKLKMFVSAIIVMALMLSTPLVPASAATNDTVEPRAALLWCPECERMTARYLSSGYDIVSVFEVYDCQFTPTVHHDHEIRHMYDQLNCSSCGRVKEVTAHKVYCQFSGEYF